MDKAPKSPAKHLIFFDCIEVFNASEICLNSKTLLVYILMLLNYSEFLCHLGSRGEVEIDYSSFSLGCRLLKRSRGLLYLENESTV